MSREGRVQRELHAIRCPSTLDSKAQELHFQPSRQTSEKFIDVAKEADFLGESQLTD
jgi:hypothetical protein